MLNDPRVGPVEPDLGDRPGYYLVGVRRDGSRLILAGCRSRAQAERQQARFAEHLEGYAEIVVEEAGGLAAGDRKPRECPGCGHVRPLCYGGLCLPCTDQEDAEEATPEPAALPPAIHEPAPKEWGKRCPRCRFLAALTPRGICRSCIAQITNQRRR